MTEEPKSFWKKSWTFPHWVRACLIVVAAIFSIGFVGAWISQSDLYLSFRKCIPDNAFILLSCIAIAMLLLCLWKLAHWLFCRRNLKRTAFVLALFATLIALFYAEEDWRGKH